MDYVLYFVANPSRAALDATREGLDVTLRRVSTLRPQRIHLAFEQSAARALAKIVFPGAGLAVSGGVAFAGTWAVGEAAIAYFIQGRNIREARRVLLKRRAARGGAETPRRTRERQRLRMSRRAQKAAALDPLPSSIPNSRRDRSVPKRWVSSVLR